MRTLVTLLLAAAISLAADTKVQMKDLPPAVQQTVKEQTQNAKLKGLSKEVENGKTFYEIETLVNGKARDLLVDANGAIVAVEEPTTLDSIPAPARAAIQKEAGKNKIASIETVTKGATVSYEAAIKKGGKEVEFMVNADGTPVK